MENQTSRLHKQSGFVGQSVGQSLVGHKMCGSRGNQTHAQER